ncbi:hypothetical protein HDU98_010329 [Podochytrium sp. JEL0797]|nr:hypothetical protein HDU98_010329 [Podochytrium sp. JEL0797]
MSAKQAIHLLTHPSTRLKWDAVMDNYNYVVEKETFEGIDEGFHVTAGVTHSRLEPAARGMIAARDFVDVSVVVVVADEGVKDPHYSLIWESLHVDTHKEFIDGLEIPGSRNAGVTAEAVRGHNFLGGLRVSHLEGSNTETECWMEYCVKSDIKGSIPVWIVDMGTGSTLDSIFTELRKTRPHHGLMTFQLGFVAVVLCVQHWLLQDFFPVGSGQTPADDVAERLFGAAAGCGFVALLLQILRLRGVFGGAASSTSAASVAPRASASNAPSSRASAPSAANANASNSNAAWRRCFAIVAATIACEAALAILNTIGLVIVTKKYNIAFSAYGEGLARSCLVTVFAMIALALLVLDAISFTRAYAHSTTNHSLHSNSFATVLNTPTVTPTSTNNLLERNHFQHSQNSHKGPPSDIMEHEDIVLVSMFCALIIGINVMAVIFMRIEGWGFRDAEQWYIASISTLDTAGIITVGLILTATSTKLVNLIRTFLLRGIRNMRRRAADRKRRVLVRRALRASRKESSLRYALEQQRLEEEAAAANNLSEDVEMGANPSGSGVLGLGKWASASTWHGSTDAGKGLAVAGKTLGERRILKSDDAVSDDGKDGAIAKTQREANHHVLDMAASSATINGPIGGGLKKERSESALTSLFGLNIRDSRSTVVLPPPPAIASDPSMIESIMPSTSPSPFTRIDSIPGATLPSLGSSSRQSTRTPKVDDAITPIPPPPEPSTKQSSTSSFLISTDDASTTPRISNTTRNNLNLSTTFLRGHANASMTMSPTSIPLLQLPSSTSATNTPLSPMFAYRPPIQPQQQQPVAQKRTRSSPLIDFDLGLPLHRTSTVDSTTEAAMELGYAIDDLDESESDEEDDDGDEDEDDESGGGAGVGRKKRKKRKSDNDEDGDTLDQRGAKDLMKEFEAARRGVRWKLQHHHHHQQQGKQEVQGGESGEGNGMGIQGPAFRGSMLSLEKWSWWKVFGGSFSFGGDVSRSRSGSGIPRRRRSDISLGRSSGVAGRRGTRVDEEVEGMDGRGDSEKEARPPRSENSEEVGPPAPIYGVTSDMIFGEAGGHGGGGGGGDGARLQISDDSDVIVSSSEEEEDEFVDFGRRKLDGAEEPGGGTSLRTSILSGVTSSITTFSTRRQRKKWSLSKPLQQVHEFMDLHADTVSVGLLIALTLFGGSGLFLLCESDQWDYVDALYFMYSLITTTGYGDIYPQSGWGRTLVIIMIFVGLGLWAYAVSTIVARLQAVKVGVMAEKIHEERVAKKRELSNAAAASGVPGDGNGGGAGADVNANTEDSTPRKGALRRRFINI